MRNASSTIIVCWWSAPEHLKQEKSPQNASVELVSDQSQESVVGQRVNVTDKPTPPAVLMNRAEVFLGLFGLAFFISVCSPSFDFAVRAPTVGQKNSYLYLPLLQHGIITSYTNRLWLRCSIFICYPDDLYGCYKSLHFLGWYYSCERRAWLYERWSWDRSSLLHKAPLVK